MSGPKYCTLFVSGRVVDSSIGEGYFLGRFLKRSWSRFVVSMGISKYMRGIVSGLSVLNS